MGASLTVFAYGGGMDARQLCLGEDLTIFKERQMDLIEVLGFLFMLSTMELGRVRVSLLNLNDVLCMFAGLFDGESR